MVSDFDDDFPVGWALTYFVRNPAEFPGRVLHTGRVAGPSVADPETGVERVPVASSGSVAGAPNVWISHDDIIGFAPSGGH